MRLLSLCVAVGLLALGSSAATADPRAKQLTDRLELVMAGVAGPPEGKPPRLSLIDGDVKIAPDSMEDAVGVQPDSVGAEKTVVAVAADGKSAWIAANLGEYMVCGMAECENQKPSGYYHGTALFDLGGGKPEYLAWHIAKTVTAKEQKQALAKKVNPDQVPRGVVPGAEAAAALFEASIGTPALLAASVSDRKDVVLYGSELRERVVGGAAVRKTLTSWNLAFAVRGGVQAGVTPSKTVAWVAASVDARSMKRPKDAATPYLALFLYEKDAKAGAWKLVQAHFAFVR